jgi:predicted nucleic acid-binding protein
MTFDDIPAGAALFVDANPFVYHFTSPSKFGPSCTALLERLERRELDGWTSPPVLAEVCHRLMTIEACTAFGWPFQKVAARLRQQPDAIQKLSQFANALDEIDKLKLRMVQADDADVRKAAQISRQFGLLTNDALLVVCMQKCGVTNLASNDSDFDRLPGMCRYAPT